MKEGRKEGGREGGREEGREKGGRGVRREQLNYILRQIKATQEQWPPCTASV